MPNTTPKISKFLLNARSDSADFRDHIYQPSLVQLKKEIIPNHAFIKIRNQETEGTCTGNALAGLIDYLNNTRKAAGIVKAFNPVSARMLYEMAKQHDRWPGEEYEGSSARGAMKGWYKNGVCLESDWRYKVGKPSHLTSKRQKAALEYPLGAYYRVMKQRTSLQVALNEVPALYVTANVHEGWRDPKNGIITYNDNSIGGHAFVVLGYTEDGFIVQNSWGNAWGGLKINRDLVKGVAIWSYPDFEKNVKDIWVARMALPLQSLDYIGGRNIVATTSGVKRQAQKPPRHQIMHHYIHIDDGHYQPSGDYPTHKGEIKELIANALEADHILFYAHGGLNKVSACAQRAATWRPVFKRNNICEIHFIWETGILEELKDVIFGKQKRVQDRAGGFSDWMDTLIEKVTHPLGHPVWKEMISDAEIAFEKNARRAGTDFISQFIKAYNTKTDRLPEIHMVGHSAGSIWLAHMLKRWTESKGPKIDNLILYAPACTIDLFESHIKPTLEGSDLKQLTHFLLTDQREKDDTVAIYRKSLLYLVSNSFQKPFGKLFSTGAPLMGMEKFSSQLKKAASKLHVTTYLAGEDTDFTDSKSHGGFDNDMATMNFMLEIVLTKKGSGFKKNELKGY